MHSIAVMASLAFRSNPSLSRRLVVNVMFVSLFFLLILQFYTNDYLSALLDVGGGFLLIVSNRKWRFNCVYD